MNLTGSRKEVVGKSVSTAITFICGIIMVLPFIWMLSSSLKTNSEIYIFPIQWLPSSWKFSNYTEVWFNQNPPYYIYYLNSIKVALLSVIGQVITCSLAAYAFARLEFKGRDKIFLLYLATIMIPFQALMVPRFILFKLLGIYNTHWALILPGIFNVFGTFLLRQSFITIPKELSEAARIDGANEFKTYYKIILPLATPALISLALLSFAWVWNDYEGPLIFLSKSNLYTIPLGLTNFIEQSLARKNNLIMAASVMAIFPILIIFILGQKFIVSGITAGSVKG